MKSELILIVDDNQSNLRLMEAILSAEDYGVKCAKDAEEALELLRNWQPKLILMDIQLPGIDGLELTRRLKKNPRYNQIVIIALTAYAMKGDEDKARTAGCDGYITKPIDTRTLPAVLARHLGPSLDVPSAMAAPNGRGKGARPARANRMRPRREESLSRRLRGKTDGDAQTARRS
jgi:two-component system, cell cycle response regulator DivK